MRYFHYWCKNSAPYGLLVDSSTGAVGLIRKDSLSLFRCLEDIELLIYGMLENLDFPKVSLWTRSLFFFFSLFSFKELLLILTYMFIYFQVLLMNLVIL